MPTYNCAHYFGPGGAQTFTHQHAGTQACTLNNEDSSCPPDKPLQSCAPVAAAGGGPGVGTAVVIGVAVVVVIVVVVWWWSDIRLKRDIVLLHRLANGIGVYSYRYLWSDQLYVGVMAQEVAGIVPAAVRRGIDGYLRVDYARLGLKLLRREEWVAERDVPRNEAA